MVFHRLLATKWRPISKSFCNLSNKDRLKKFLEEIEQQDKVPVSQTEENELPTTTPQTMEPSVRFKLERFDVNQVMEFLRSMNAVEPCLLDVRGKTSFADYLIISSGRNSSHISFMARKLAKEVAAVSSVHRRPLVYGKERSDWIAIDMGRIVVHCMLQETRERYQMEQLWLEDTEQDIP